MAETGDHHFDLCGKRVWVAGHTGMVGSALVRRLQNEGCDLLQVSHDELDLTRQADTEAWMARARPDAIFIAAAMVGGIIANSTYPANFLYDNAMIAMNIMHTAHQLGVQKLLWLGSSCVYPKFAEQPISEDSLLTGALEPTNEAYAVAKIAGLKLAEAYARQYGQRFITAMPTNLYGPNDNFDLQNAHVLPALIRKMHEAKIAGSSKAIVWGTGTPKREFLHVDDLADACVFIMKNHAGPEIINIGSGREVSIGELAKLIAGIVGYEGTIVFDTTKPDGTPRKLVDPARLESMGWRPSVALEAGISDLYLRWQQSMHVSLSEKRIVTAA
ncbi:GDP-L-fucose synthase [Phyllobacterium sp. YR620]|uniref:GDP-L-fucose synthase family protein n=1 Tax=Phyllobacterium sp. YR620 TaxID=1881066 RepID=UPI0008915825|nr:GDP-L-fucose synthase [Phyllobacterium sp. YR620]SDP81428.1 GDP-L-fucose synthase [Phyllobacterium sp. YR620]